MIAVFFSGPAVSASRKDGTSPATVVVAPSLAVGERGCPGPVAEVARSSAVVAAPLVRLVEVAAGNFLDRGHVYYFQQILPQSKLTNEYSHS